MCDDTPRHSVEAGEHQPHVLRELLEILVCPLVNELVQETEIADDEDVIETDNGSE